MFPAVLLFNLVAGTDTATLGTWEIVRPSDAPSPHDKAWTVLNIAYTGGSTDTSVIFSLETSSDGVVWHATGNLGLTPSAKTAVAQVGAINLARFLRVKVTVTGTAPTIRTGTGLFMTTFPCTLTAI